MNTQYCATMLKMDMIPAFAGMTFCFQLSTFDCVDCFGLTPSQ
jgi:hypothetical protein